VKYKKCNNRLKTKHIRSEIIETPCEYLFSYYIASTRSSLYSKDLANAQMLNDILGFYLNNV